MTLEKTCDFVIASASACLKFSLGIFPMASDPPLTAMLTVPECLLVVAIVSGTMATFVACVAQPPSSAASASSTRNRNGDWNERLSCFIDFSLFLGLRVEDVVQDFVDHFGRRLARER